MPSAGTKTVGAVKPPAAGRKCLGVLSSIFQRFFRTSWRSDSLQSSLFIVILVIITVIIFEDTGKDYDMKTYNYSRQREAIYRFPAAPERSSHSGNHLPACPTGISEDQPRHHLPQPVPAGGDRTDSEGSLRRQPGSLRCRHQLSSSFCLHLLPQGPGSEDGWPGLFEHTGQPGIWWRNPPQSADLLRALRGLQMFKIGTVNKN